jgi:TolB protein
VAGGLPAWSPDGCEVAFIASLPVTEGPPESSVVIAAGDGSDPRTLYTGASILSRPEWSPDGQEVAFTSLETDQLVKLPVTGGRPRDLSPGDLDVAGPVAWSPDGAQIVLAGSAEDKRRPDLYAVRSDGGGLRQLTDTAGGEESPDWSPDGRRLAFAAYAAGGYYEDRAIVVARADGSERTRLTQDLDSNPVWSPDGRSIVFERTTTPLEETPSTADTELWVVDVDSGEERRLVAAPALEPFWSPATEAP